MKDEMKMSQSVFSRSSKMKRLRLISVAAVLLAVCLAFVGGAAGEEDLWDGTVDTTWYNDFDTEFTLTTAEQLAGLADLVDDSKTFAGKTIKLGADIDLYLEDTSLNADGDPVTFRPIGDHSKNGVFEGIFDGQGHTIENLYQNGWDLGYDWYNYGSYGLFGNVNDATIKDLKISGSESYIEGGDTSFVTGSATGTCVFENIIIEDSVSATYNNGNGGIIGWSGAGEYTFKNIKISEDCILAGLWGSFDSSIGGIVGQAEPGATYNFEDVDIACRLDVYNDCTASYDYYNYRMCGMIIGRLEKTTQIDGKNYPDTSEYNINCDTVKVTYGNWANYHYCDPTPGYNNGRGMRVEAGYSYDGLPADYDHSQCTTHHMELIPFDQIFGGAQLGVKGLKTYDGVTVYYEVSFETNGGPHIESQKIEHNSIVSKPEDPKKEGHTFEDWYSDLELTTTYDFGTSVVEPLTLYANWTINQYTITFNTDGGSEISAITQDYATDVTAPANPTKTGYTFSNWNPEIPATMPAKDMTVIAQWVANTSTVTFNAGEGTVSETLRTVTFDQPYRELPTPTRDGYEFVGWYLNDKPITADTKVTVDGDHTLTAFWEIIETQTPVDEIPEEEIITTSSGGSGISGYSTFPRTTINGGYVGFGYSKVITGVILPEGSSGSVILKVDTIEGWTNILETEYTFDISVQTMGDGMAYILFEIPLRTLENLGITPADVCAYHFVDGEWVMLKTTYEVKERTVFYEAETDSFSPFKLVFEEGAATPKAEETEPVIPPTEEPENKPEDIAPPIDEPTKPSDEPETPAPLLAVLAGLGAAVVLRRK